MFFAPSFLASAVNSAMLVGIFALTASEEVGAIRDHARARVVGNAVDLAAVLSRLREPGEPGALVRERVRGQVLERARRHVLRHLGVPHLDDVGRAVPRQRRVELREVGVPCLVLDVDVPAGVLGLELRIRGGHDLWPSGLRVYLKPNRQRVGGLATRGSGGSHRRDGERRNEHRCGKNTYVHSHPPRQLGTRPGRTVKRGSPRPECPSGLYQSATAGRLPHLRSSVKPPSAVALVHNALLTRLSAI